MRIWDIHPKYLCRKHLLSEHRELHGLWNILVVHGGIGGYSRHPETLRWVGKTKALFLRHELLVEEFSRRGYTHRTPLDANAAGGDAIQSVYLHSIEQQKEILAGKGCSCSYRSDDVE